MSDLHNRLHDLRVVKGVGPGGCGSVGRKRWRGKLPNQAD